MALYVRLLHIESFKLPITQNPFHQNCIAKMHFKQRAIILPEETDFFAVLSFTRKFEISSKSRENIVEKHNSIFFIINSAFSSERKYLTKNNGKSG